MTNIIVLSISTCKSREGDTTSVFAESSGWDDLGIHPKGKPMANLDFSSCFHQLLHTYHVLGAWGAMLLSPHKNPKQERTEYVPQTWALRWWWSCDVSLDPCEFKVPVLYNRCYSSLRSNYTSIFFLVVVVVPGIEARGILPPSYTPSLIFYSFYFETGSH